MRRLTLAALSAALVLSACGDQSPTEPNVPPPAETFGTTCTVTRFPLQTALDQIKTVFPTARLRLEASLRAGAIALLWNTCYEKLAQRGALDFVKWMGRQTLPITEAAKQAQNDLIVTMLSGVGLLDLPPDASGGNDFGIGLYDPTITTPQVFSTIAGTALTELRFGAFSEFTVIVISRRPDDSEPLNFDGRQFPPFFDYDAINASGNHFFENGETATIAFCQLPETEIPDFQYPEFADIKIGHNKPARLTPPEDPAFELLDPEEVPEHLEELLDCEKLETAFADFGGLRNLARATGRSLAPIARAIFMPAPLQAATATMGYTGPISTKTGSFSPFGIVEFTPNQIENSGGDVGSEGAGPFYVGYPLDTCNDACFPEFRVTDGEVPIQTPTSLTVSLVPGEGSTGTLSGTTTKSTSATSPYTAEFNDLMISAPGTYQLLVSGPGVASYTTGSFTVTAPPANELNLTGDPSTVDKTYFINSVLSWECGELSTCYPAVRLVDWRGDGVPGVNVTVTLDLLEAGGSFASGSTTTVTTSSDPAGYAVFDNLSIDENGSYGLTFSASGVVPVTTATSFFVSNPIE